MHTTNTTPRPLPVNYPLTSDDRRALRHAIRRAVPVLARAFDTPDPARLTRAELIATARALGIDARAIVTNRA